MSYQYDHGVGVTLNASSVARMPRMASCFWLRLALGSFGNKPLIEAGGRRRGRRT